MNEAVFAFETTLDAIRAEQLLQRQGFAPRVMPMPSSIKAGCGLCVRVDESAAKDAVCALAQAGLAHSGVFTRWVV